MTAPALPEAPRTLSQLVDHHPDTARVTDSEIECLADDGRLTIIAVQGGVAAGFDAGALMRRRLTVTGSTLRPRSTEYKASIGRALRERVWPLIEAGRVKPVVHRVFPAAQAAQAHALMESGRHVGKIMLTW